MHYIPQGERRENRVEKTLEVIMFQNFSKLKTDNKPHIQEGQKTPGQKNIRKKQTKNIHLIMSCSNCRKLKTKKLERDKSG